MDFRVIVSVLLNLAAFVVPTFGLWAGFGLDHKVNVESSKDMMALFGAAVFGFAVTLVSSAFLRKADSEGGSPIRLVESIGRALGRIPEENV